MEDFGKFVGVLRAQRAFHVGVAFARGFNEQGEFLRAFRFAAPVVDLRAGRQYLDTGGLALFHQLGG